jgi:5-methylcytosine-specific restriction endonuclease McrBC regulatory subunit McrC
MIRQALEGATTWLPGLTASDIPYPLPSGVTIHVRGSEVGIEIQGLAGAIPLLNGDTLQILPKVGRVNFLRLLFRAEGSQRDLEREYEDFVSYSVDSEQNIDSIVARQLLHSAAEIMKRSPQKGRAARRREGLFAAGRMDVMETALNIARRKQEPVSYYIKERTVDIAENRVLTEAVGRAWALLDSDNRVELRWAHDRWLDRFPGSRNLTLDMEEVERGFAEGRYGGSRDYYRRALMLAQIILGSAGLGFSEAAAVEGDAILLNTPDIFERYLRNVVSAAYSEAGYVVTKGGLGVTSLYTDGSFELEPDIVISRDGRTVLIADAKYKLPTAADHYQMHTYLAAHGVKRGLLLAPLYEGEEVLTREYATSDRTVVREIFLPMNDLDTTEEYLGKMIERFALTCSPECIHSDGEPPALMADG